MLAYQSMSTRQLLQRFASKRSKKRQLRLSDRHEDRRRIGVWQPPFHEALQKL